MNLPSQFNTKRLHLRPRQRSDLPSIFAYAGDPEVTRLMDWPTHTSISDTEAHFNASGGPREDEITWAVTLSSNGTLIGSAACSAEGHKVSMGYVLAKDYWGQGYASEMAQEIVALLSADSSVARIWATCDTENLASAKVLENAGLVREGVLRNWAIRPNLSGAPVRDCFVYAKV